MSSRRPGNGPPPRGNGLSKEEIAGQLQFDGFLCETSRNPRLDAPQRPAPTPPPPRPAAAPQPPARSEQAPSEAMLHAAREAIFREAAARGLVPSSVPWDQALTLAETWRALADAAVNAAWAARK